MASVGRYGVEFRLIVHVDAKDYDEAVEKARELLNSTPDPKHILWDADDEAVWEE